MRSCGFKSSLIRYEADVTEEELLAKVRELNEDADVDGFIVQLPLPRHISEQKVIETIDYRKDVDGSIPSMWDGCPLVFPAMYPLPPTVSLNC